MTSPSHDPHRTQPQAPPAPQPINWKSVSEIAVVLATLLGTAAAIVALTNKIVIVIFGLMVMAGLGGLAIYAWSRRHKTAGWAFGGASTLLLVAIIAYALWPSNVITEGKAIGSQQQPGSSQPGSSPDVSKQSTQQASQPAFQGSAPMVNGQSIDLEVANPKAKSASALRAPDDVFIDTLSFVSDRDGQLLSFAGSDATTGKADCLDLWESGKKRQPTFALPAQMSYCVHTSDDRIALVQFTAGDYYGRVGNISYWVWDR